MQPTYQSRGNGIYQDALALQHKLIAYAYVLLGAVYGLVLGSYEVALHIVQDLQSREGRRRLVHGDPLYSTGQTKLLSQQPAGVKGTAGAGHDALGLRAPNPTPESDNPAALLTRISVACRCWLHRHSAEAQRLSSWSHTSMPCVLDAPGSAADPGAAQAPCLTGMLCR